MVAEFSRPEDPRKDKRVTIDEAKYQKYSKVVDATFALAILGVVILMGIFIALVYYTATCKCQ